MRQLTDFENVLKARQQLVHAQLKLVEVRNELETVVQAQDEAQRRRESRAEAILEGRAPDHVDLAPQLKELRQRISDLDAACELGKRRKQDAEGRASLEIAEEARPGYVAIVKRMIAALTAAAAIAIEERQFRSDLESRCAGGSMPLPPAAFNGLYDADTHDSRLGYWARHVVAAGYATPEDFAPALRKAWRVDDAVPTGKVAVETALATVARIGKKITSKTGWLQSTEAD